MPSFSQEIAEILSQARHKAGRVVNFIVVEAYWEVGCRIVEEEQEGAHRAEYGSNLLKHLSIDLKKCLGKRLAPSNLSTMREFYTCFPNFEAVRQELSWIATNSVLNENKQLFASRYKLYLPSEEELRLEMERERHIIQQQNPK